MTGSVPPEPVPAAVTGGQRGGGEADRRGAGFDVLVRHWWNRQWGRLGRRDVYIRTDGVLFELELRAGGAEGRRARCVFADLDAAVDEAGRHMAADQDWADVTAAHTPRAHRRGEVDGPAG